MTTRFDSALKWFTGKALENATAALALLAESEEQGFWIPAASRKVRAAMTKSNVARKLANANRNRLKTDYSSEASMEATKARWQIEHTLMFSGVRTLKQNDLSALIATTPDRETLALIETTLNFMRDLAPAFDAMHTLDDTRPKPVFTGIGVSRTITATLAEARLDLDVATIRVCPIKWVKVECKHPKTGAIYWDWVGYLDWPKTTRHDASRFSGERGGSKINHQCHACGHAIRNGNNWVPILIDSKEGVPHSLWVGRDCAQRVFGIKMTGDLKFADGVKGGAS